MIKKLIVTSIFYIFMIICYGQSKQHTDTLLAVYYAEMKAVSDDFSKAYYPNRSAIYSLPEREFLKELNSLKQPFIQLANKHYSAFRKPDKKFIPNEMKDIEYFFDTILLNYPYFHENYTGRAIKLSNSTRRKLNKHLKDFNSPELLLSKDFKGYVEAFMRHQSSAEVKKEQYRTSDNKRLDAYLNLVPSYFTNHECRDYWNYHYLHHHLEEFGSKNINSAIKNFLSTCQNPTYTKAIDSLYTESANSYKGHIVEAYKTVDGYTLDLHIFLPDTSHSGKARPTIVYFSGGSWTQGTPEWNFYNCADYEKKGWVAVAVEYRLADRHETTPYEAVKDARSAIRWLRMNAGRYNIDSNRIVASGNSAGGHLVLSTALANEVNESSDNLSFSPVPNLLLVNAGVYDLLWDEGTNWISRALNNKSMVTSISPQHLLRKGLPPLLVIHGTNDQSVAYESAVSFAEQMKQLGNELVFETLEGAPHYIWYDRRFSGRVAGLRKEFLKKHGYEL
ncbi:alpha/beta hydrolase [Pontibacter sp. HSC-14F20]|uniref:alpha/beta hydrolase n=1 Tax=Pontibacter sp. HSC-14F20 TaxID=2864136 RepID=UPI001C729F55|nr:alpha/beta hydrolase [Pontibacter sp. HSC-14F20]MBX0333945.1 alpha/beta hydrolase [Pontibacter sp. HSC-14F20]